MRNHPQAIGFLLNVLFAAAHDVFDREVSHCEMSYITLSATRGNLCDRLRPCVDIHAPKCLSEEFLNHMNHL